MVYSKYAPTSLSVCYEITSEMMNQWDSMLEHTMESQSPSGLSLAILDNLPPGIGIDESHVSIVQAN